MVLKRTLTMISNSKVSMKYITFCFVHTMQSQRSRREQLKYLLQLLRYIQLQEIVKNGRQLLHAHVILENSAR